jgi:oxalate decarboxylase
MATDPGDRTIQSRKPTEAAPEATATRREFVAAGPAALVGAIVASAAAAQTPEIAARRPVASDPGPENRRLTDINPDVFLPPTTDRGEVQSFWQSFALSRRRIQDGGWTRQVNVRDFPISKEMAGVNMRLTAGGVRELHWHAAAEWAMMLTGNARLTAIDDQGRSYVNDVARGDLWYFPEGIPHSIQGLGPDGCEFLLVFDDGKFSEDETTLLSDWVLHTPREVLARNWGVRDAALAPLDALPREGLYIFQAPVPGPLAEDKRLAAGRRAPSPTAFDFKMLAMEPTRRNRSGEVRIVDSRNFPVSKKIAAAHVLVRPGGMRELHWHPNSDEWLYFLEGQARMTLFVNGSKARTADFRSGDVGYVPQTLPHYVENTGDSDLIFLEMFKADQFKSLSLSDWLTHTPPDLVGAHLHLGKETIDTMPHERVEVMPE